MKKENIMKALKIVYKLAVICVFINWTWDLTSLYGSTLLENGMVHALVLNENKLGSLSAVMNTTLTDNFNESANWVSSSVHNFEVSTLALAGLGFIFTNYKIITQLKRKQDK